MPDETPNRPAETPHSGRHPRRGGEGGSPLQARAAFVENWDWKSITSINRGTCARGGAQHGINQEAGSACEEDWERQRHIVVTLGETLDFLKSCHRQAPFLFFNGNTFSFIGRELALALFSDLPPVRKKEVASVIAHYIAGVLDRTAMVETVESLTQNVGFGPGSRVKTLRGTLRGVVVRILDDGRVAWKPDGAAGELMALPESLAPDE